MRKCFEEIFAGKEKPLIAMVHLPPLPGTPLYDESAGVEGLLESVERDISILPHLYLSSGRQGSRREVFESVPASTARGQPCHEC